MLRINDIRLEIGQDTIENLTLKAADILNISTDKIKKLTLVKKSVDARKKQELHYVCSVNVELYEDEEKFFGKIKNTFIKQVEKTSFEIKKVNFKQKNRPVVCGFGPAGMFCSLTLARAGLCPIVIERGADVDTRTKEVERFFSCGELNENSNVQFGEGGAGTFSDGKLTCGINDVRMNYILSELVRFGADEDILYMAKPHIGTDVLRNVVKNLRQEVINLGGEVHFNTRLCDMKLSSEKLVKIICEGEKGPLEIDCDSLIVAIGHSARDTFSLLYEKGIKFEQKPFSMGVRIEHLQSMINTAQYGQTQKAKLLGSADYKLSCKLPDGRGVYTFCMCPGGSVVAAASEKGGVVTNGMSLRLRNGKNANAALLCDVRTSDFGSEHPLAGVDFQRKWEKAAYILGQKSYKAPVNLVGDFLEGRIAKKFGEVEPTYKPGVVFADLRECMPKFVSHALVEGIKAFDKRIAGFANRDAVMTGVETRSSSPVRIVRNKEYESNKKGLYPCGEGAGYAGGIMSAALDGIKVACHIIDKLCEK